MLDSNPTTAKNLPPLIHFGTSSWTYPGWKGSIYTKPYKDEKTFKAECLAEYAEHPWFRTVGIDSTFYGPPHPKTLARYASQTPEAFAWVSKVWEQITIPRYATHARYGDKAGKENPDFLNATRFIDEVLGRYQEPEIKQRTGPFVFQFQTMGRELVGPAGTFLNRLGDFLGQLPKDFKYAVEIRNKELLNAEYFQTLNKSGVTHCFNHWTRMPALKEQMKAAALAGGLSADFYVARILTPLGLSYADAVQRFQPYDRIKQENPEMRADVVRLAKRALKRNVKAYVIVNNRAEGNSPKTIEAIGTSLVEELNTQGQ